MARTKNTKSKAAVTESDVEALKTAIASLSARTLASVGVKYLGEEGLERLVELLKERIAAVDGDGKYLPLSGGTVKGSVTIGGGVLTAGYVVITDDLVLDGDFDVSANVYFYSLTENTDAPNVIVAGSDGRLYKAPVSGFGGGDYLPLAGGTVTGDIVLGSSGARITAEGHIVLASGIEIY